MNREKKQMVVMGALLFMILAIGAFQFSRGEDTPPPAAAGAEKTEKKQTDAEKKLSEAKAAIKNPDFATPLMRRDPFAVAAFGEPEKKDLPKPEPTAPLPRTKPDPLKWDPDSAPIGGDPTPVAPPEPVFGFSLIGVVSGNYPAAVFVDASGNQRLIEVGRSIDGDSTLISISRGEVRVKFHAKTLVLTVGGNPSEK